MPWIVADYYVYLLVEHDPTGAQPDQIFYVGKGKDRRALDHLDEAIATAARVSPGELTTALEDALPVDSAQAPEHAATELHERTVAIHRAIASGRTVRVDRLRGGLDEAAAFAMESAVIDVLGRENLTNRVAGHDAQRTPLPLLRSLELASSVTFAGEKAVVVPGSGIWGGGDSIGGLLSASADSRWENARHYWALQEAAQDQLRALADQGDPALLLSVATGIGPWRGIVLLVEAITNVSYEQRGDGTTGCAFDRAPDDSPALQAAREKFLGRRLSDFPVQPGVRYSPALRSLIP